jgi:AGCS family alanine or glycine:cation symporter
MLFLTFTFLGSVVSPVNILEFSDMMILAMSVPNLIGVFLLSNVVYRRLQDYLARKKQGTL